MLEVVAGPILFAFGVTCIYLAIHGLPSNLKLPRLALPRRRTGGRAIPPGDALVVEMLTEMLHLREQVSELKSQLETRRSRGKRTTTKLAS